MPIFQPVSLAARRAFCPSLPMASESWSSWMNAMAVLFFSLMTLSPVAAAGEVHAGPATILSNVEGDAVREYDVEILQVVENAADGRDLVISVTDPELLAATGGIVQGMSGSPILQDGKFAGAVTHVLLNDPSKGYGILMETMLAAGDFSEEPVA